MSTSKKINYICRDRERNFTYLIGSSIFLRITEFVYNFEGIQISQWQLVFSDPKAVVLKKKWEKVPSSTIKQHIPSIWNYAQLLSPLVAVNFGSCILFHFIHSFEESKNLSACWRWEFVRYYYVISLLLHGEK